MAPDTTGLPRQSNVLDIPKDTKMKQKKEFVTKYMDKRAQAKFVSYSNTAPGVLDLIC
jgi:hypothetical protein